MNTDNVNCACKSIDVNTNVPNDDNCFGQTVCVAYAYVVPQTMNKTYEPDTALSNGTMFPELNIPFGCYVPNEETGGNKDD